MNRRNNLRAALLLLLIVMGIIVYGAVTGIEMVQVVANLILLFIIADGFATFYGFYQLPGTPLWWLRPSSWLFSPSRRHLIRRRMN